MIHLLQKYGFWDEMTNVQQEHSFDEMNSFQHGVDGDRTLDQDRRENHSPDGDDDLEEIKEMKQKRDKRLARIKKMKNKVKDMKKDDGDVALQPTPFYSSVYGYTGLEGTFEIPVEYYSGGITNEPGAITNNPYNSIYQPASERLVRLILRASYLNNLHISA